MNAQRLKQFIEFLLSQEERFQIQPALGQVRDWIGNLAGSPNDAATQTQFAEAMTGLRKAIDETQSSLTPAQGVVLDELNGKPYFTRDLVDTIERSVAENPLTPAVVRDTVGRITEERAGYLSQARQLNDSMQYFGIHSTEISEGEAEIGLTIPRTLFENRIDGLSSQIHRLDLIFRFVSEATVGTAEHATIGDISSTDPSFFFGLSPETIAQVANCFTWALDTLKKIAGLKSTIDTLKGYGLKKSQIKGVEDAIDEKIDEAVKAKVEQLMALQPHEEGRASELETGLQWALSSIMASVERGVTVELKFIPPAQQPEPGGTASSTFEALRDAREQLAFPPASAAPVLQLPSPEPPVEPLSDRERDSEPSETAS